MMRIPIGGCDFDLAPWAYNEKPRNDVNLTHFTALDQRDLERVSGFYIVLSICLHNTYLILYLSHLETFICK